MVKKSSSGLTLTELLIVIGIIVFLILLAILLTRGQIFKGNDARRKSDIHKIQVAIEEYEKDNDCYPLPQVVTCDPGNGLQPYIDKIPCDPTTDTSYYYEHEDDLCPGWYLIYAKLENDQDSDVTAMIGPYGAYNYYAASPNAPTQTPTPTSGSSPAPGGGSGGQQASFYGCKEGSCVAISWDPARPGPECDPNYQNPTCYGQCVSPSTECQPWDQ